MQAGTTAAALAGLARAKHLSSIAVQLYTVRNVIPSKPLETLRGIQEIGYDAVEATQAMLPQMWTAFEQTKLEPLSIHMDSKAVTQGPADDIARAAEDFKKRGFTFAVFPYLPPNERGGLDVIKKLAAKLNQAGEKCHAAGLRFCYHNHAFEFQPMEGKTPFQVLLAETDPKLVGIEMDLFWVSVAGHDPAEMLGHAKGRVPLVHLKDKAQGTPVQYNESVPRTAFKEVGHGVINWAQVLKAADAAGVEHYIVEQDQTPGDPLVSLRQSYEYLSKLNY